MNDNELGRRLRSEMGPRERGYEARSLPASLDEGRPTRPRGNLLRVAVMAPAVAAGIAAVAIGAAMLSGWPGDRGIGSGGTTPSSTSSGEAQLQGCTNQDVSFDAEAWGGAAGSRGTVLTVGRAATGRDCLLGQPFSIALLSETGKQLVQGDSPVTVTDSVRLDADHRYRIGIGWSNWCGEEPSQPIGIAPLFPGWEDGEYGFYVQGQTVPIPPCMGEGQPSNLSVTELQPAN